eukprot:1160869-Pelagomonas_calceolata.AAC.4
MSKLTIALGRAAPPCLTYNQKCASAHTTNKRHSFHVQAHLWGGSTQLHHVCPVGPAFAHAVGGWHPTREALQDGSPPLEQGCHKRALPAPKLTMKALQGDDCLASENVDFSRTWSRFPLGRRGLRTCHTR